MSPVFQGLLLVGDLVFLFLIFVMVKNGRLSVRFSLPWLALGAGMLVLASIWAEVIQVSATTEPMEMSMPPISRTKVMPMVAMISAALSISRLQNTWGLMKPR